MIEGLENLKSNVLDDKKTKEIIKFVLEDISNTISKSAGPYGATSIVSTAEGPRMSKDGWTILKELKYNMEVPLTILKIIQRISAKLVMQVGDGSSTSVIAGKYLFDELVENKLKCRPKEVQNILETIVNKVIEELKILARPVSDELDEIKELASISLNNDEKIGEMIKDMYKEVGKDGFINVERGKSNITKYTKTRGFQINNGVLDPILINTEMNDSILKDAALLIFNAPLSTQEDCMTVKKAFEYINTLGSTKYKSLVIVAPGYATIAQKLLREIVTVAFNGHRECININAIKMPNADQMDANIYADLAMKTSSVIVLNSEEERIKKIQDTAKYVGYVGKVVSNYKTTTFIDGEESEDIKIRIASIKAELSKLSTTEDDINHLAKIYELKKRLAIMQNKLVTIYVGGNSELEISANKDLVEDAVSACRSAIRYGYVNGCNISIMKVLNEMLKIEKEKATATPSNDEIMISLLLKAFKNVYETILLNKFDKDFEQTKVSNIISESVAEYKCFNLLNDTFEDGVIINSVETEMEILKSISSIIGLLFTSNQFVSVNPMFEIN